VPAQFAEQLLQIGQEIFWRSLMLASATGPSSPRMARSIMAVTAKRPLVVKRIPNS
jgi:hypothetical protein